MTSYLLYFDGTVYYNGRASSTLGPGRFLLLRKNDGSVSIHGGSLIVARNYIGKNAKCQSRNNYLSFCKGGESLTIEMANIIYCQELNDWSEDLVQVVRTEQELVEKLFDNWFDYFDVDFDIIYTEYSTSLGSIDMLGIDSDGVHHVVEVKRRKCSISAVSQLKRYVDELSKNNRVQGYLAAPAIGKNVARYLEELGFRWIRIDF